VEELAVEVAADVGRGAVEALQHLVEHGRSSLCVLLLFVCGFVCLFSLTVTRFRLRDAFPPLSLAAAQSSACSYRVLPSFSLFF